VTVTLENWRSAPHNRWSFQHVREIVPTADIPNAPERVWELPRAPVDVTGFDLDGWLAATDTDAFVILRHGTIVCERYAHGMTPHTPHILMSVSKSLTGIVAGILMANGVLDENTEVATLLPELAGTAYAGATIRNLLDMRAGIAFDEDYLATSGPIVEYRKSHGWRPFDPGDAPTDARSFYRQLTAADGPHGGRFHYVSPNTDLLGLAIEQASGERFADLMSALLWQPLGAERSAYITVDRLGAPRTAGGICATVTDLARIGQLILDGGVRAGRTVVPDAWIADVVANGDAEAWNAGDFALYFRGLSMHYRSQWYVVRGERPVLFALGVHGQNLFVFPDRGLVFAKVSSQVLPMDTQRIEETTRGVMALAKLLTS
jgi:CubicO group peptidase (beta-lactamase class C family)